MTYRSMVSYALVAVVLLGILGGCGTPGSVTNLAKKTSDNAIDFGLSMESFVRVSAADAERRATNIARQTSSIDEARLRHDRGIALATKAGRQNPVNRYDDIKALADKWAKMEAEKKESGAAKRKTVLDDQAKLETEAAAFLEIGGQLLELSKGDSGEARVKFLVGFVKDVADDLKEAQEETKETSNVADDLKEIKK